MFLTVPRNNLIPSGDTLVYSFQLLPSAVLTLIEGFVLSLISSVREKGTAAPFVTPGNPNHESASILFFVA